MEYSVKTLLKDIIKIIRLKIKNTRLRFAIYVDGYIPCKLIGNKARICQVIIKLLNNAIKYKKNGFISLFIRRQVVDIGIMDLYIEVKNSGTGNTFTVTIPQKYKAPEPLAIAEKSKNKSVLIYE